MDEFDEIDAAVQKLGDQFNAKLDSYKKSSGLRGDQAKRALIATEGLEATKSRIREVCGPASGGTSDVEVLAETMSLGHAFLAGSEEAIDTAIQAGRRGDFLSAFMAATEVIKELDLALEFLAKEERQDKASRAANVRHLVDRRRKAEAKDLFLSKGWRVKADAARAIETTFHVTYKTAERWIIEWTKSKSPSA